MQKYFVAHTSPISHLFSFNNCYITISSSIDIIIWNI